MRVKRIVLKHHGNVALGRFKLVYYFAADTDFAIAYVFKPCHHAQQGRFATARGPNDNDKLAITYFGIHAMQHLIGLLARAVAFD